MGGIDDIEEGGIGGSGVRPRATSSRESRSWNRSLFNSGDIYSAAGVNSHDPILTSRPLVPTTSTCGGGNRQRGSPPCVGHSQTVPKLVFAFPRPEAAPSADTMAIAPVQNRSNRKLADSERCSNKTPLRSTHRLAPSWGCVKVRSAPPSARSLTIGQGDYSHDAERCMESAGGSASGPKSPSRATSSPGPPEHLADSTASTAPLHKKIPILTSTPTAASVHCSENHTVRAELAGRLVNMGSVLECEGVSDNTVCLGPARPVSAPQLLLRPSSSDSRNCTNRTGDRSRNIWESCDHLDEREERRQPLVNDESSDCASAQCHTGDDCGQGAGWCDCIGRHDDRSAHRPVPRRPQSARMDIRPSPESAETRTWKNSSLISPRVDKYRIPLRPLSARQRHIDTQRTMSNAVDNNGTTTGLSGVQVQGGAIRTPWEHAACAGDVDARRGKWKLPSRREVVRWGRETDNMLRDRARKSEGGAMLAVNGREQFVDSDTKSGRSA